MASFGAASTSCQRLGGLGLRTREVNVAETKAEVLGVRLNGEAGRTGSTNTPTRFRSVAQMGQVDLDIVDAAGRYCLQRPGQGRFEDVAFRAPVGGERDQFQFRFGKTRLWSKQAYD